MRKVLALSASLFLVAAGSCSDDGKIAVTAPAPTVKVGVVEAAAPFLAPQSADVARTGVNAGETTLTTSNVNVNSFGMLFTLPLDGDVYGQPLYVSNLAVGGTTRNVVYVVTEHDTVFAFDADDVNQTAPLWKTSIGVSVPVPNPWFGNITGTNCATQGWNLRESGITSTPVIDLASGTIYVVGLVQDPVATVPNQTCLDVVKTSPTFCKTSTCSAPVFRLELHALDITTGAEKSGSPVTVQAEAPGTGTGSVNGMISFDAALGLQRAGLLLANGSVYFATASYGDIGNYHGWVFAYDATSFQQVAAFADTPNGQQGGIWEAGHGLTADAEGNVYVITGNGTFDLDKGGSDYGDCVIKLDPHLNVLDWFSPYDSDILGTNYLEAWDDDFGASGAVVLPGLDIVMGAGKPGILYLLNTNALGGFQGTKDGSIQTMRAAWRTTKSSCSDGVGDSALFGTPVFWNGPDGPTVYLWGGDDYMKAYRLDSTGHIPTSQAVCFCPASMGFPDDPPCGAPVLKGTQPTLQGLPGGMLSISSNGTSNGTGIVWATRTAVTGNAAWGPLAGIVEAFDAEDLTHELWDSHQNQTRDDAGNMAKFTAPLIENGKVYVATFSNQIAVYGLLGQ